MRFENTPELFGGGSGRGTSGEITCRLCGITHNAGTDEEGRLPGGDSGETVVWTDFAGVAVCEDCFGQIEEEMLNRLSDFLPWVARRIAERKRMSREYELNVREVLAALDDGD